MWSSQKRTARLTLTSNHDHRVVDKAGSSADHQSTNLESGGTYERLAHFGIVSDSLAKFELLVVEFRLGFLRGPAFHKCRLGIRYYRPNTCFAIPSRTIVSCIWIAVESCRWFRSYVQKSRGRSIHGMLQDLERETQRCLGGNERRRWAKSLLNAGMESDKKPFYIHGHY